MTVTESPAELTAEDRKLVTLARATKARTRAAEGAAVRDGDGRTYAAATLDLPSLRISALAACLAMAHSSGAPGLEAAVVLTDGDEVAEADLAAVRDLAGEGVTVHRGDARGSLTGTVRS